MRSTTRARRRWLATTGAVVACMLLAGACGSDDDEDGAGTPAPETDAPATDATVAGDDLDDESAEEPVAAEPDPTDEPADDSTAPTDRTGEVIRIGYVNNEGGVLSVPEFRIGGEVAIAAINDAGGIDGAQIEVVPCLSDSTPEGAIGCANELIEADVVMAYMGIEFSSDAAIGLWNDAGIPYVTSNAWGETEKNNDQAFLLHAAAGAYAVGPLSTMADLGIGRAAVIVEDSPTGLTFMDDVVEPVAENIGIELERIIIDPAAPDWAAAIATAQAADVEAIWGQVTEPACIGLVSTTATSGYDGPVFAGSCSVYIGLLGELAIGTYTQGDLWFPAVKQFAPPEISERLTEYEELMTAAGHEDLIDGFAVAPYSSWREIEPILESIEGEITAEAITDAFANAGTTPGWLGPDLRCGLEPWPAETSHCRSEIAVWQVQDRDDGTIERVPVKEFFDAFEASGL